MAEDKTMFITAFLIICASLFPLTEQAPILKEIESLKDRDILEGDIIIDENLAKLIKGSINRATINKPDAQPKRGAVMDPIRHWKGGIVPFKMDSSVEPALRSRISEAFRIYHQISCVQFVQHTTEPDYIHIVYREGCNSHIGKQGGAQLLTIGPGCEEQNFILHELMHVLGFFHEQSRFDRDFYVKVLWWNINHAAHKNFATYSHGAMDLMGMPYDIHSLLHYDNKAFSSNGEDTIESILEPKAILGNVRGLSKLDIRKVNTLYKCNQRKNLRCYQNIC